MCAGDISTATSPISSFSSSSSSDSSLSLSLPPTFALKPTTERKRPGSFAEMSMLVSCGSLTSIVVGVFSNNFPFMLAPWAASQTYTFAGYKYTRESVFCNSAWTFITDYFLAIVLSGLLLTIPTHRSVSTSLARRSRSLLASYSLSVLAGGLAHHFYSNLDSRNSWHFRLVWTVCVGCVCFASAPMGCIGTELARIDAAQKLNLSLRIPVVPELFWVTFGMFTTLICAFGGISFQRPACDIFIAGITQFPSSFYMMLVLGLSLSTSSLPKWARIAGVLGFILNAPLLPLYPLLVQYTSWSTGRINTLLHGWLLVAWALQGISLRQVEVAIVKQNEFYPSQAVFTLRAKHS